MSPNHLSQLEEAHSRAIASGYSYSFYFYGSTVACRLTKDTYGAARVEVQGEGATPAEALAVALSNFPPNPLDGTKWKNNQLAAPGDTP